jgi:solute carrier family 25 (mitochondrial adenine nucleotide translocator), member 4/5/6/31
MYDRGKVLILDKKNPSIFAKLVFALFVTGCAGLISYPLDKVRRRLMMQSGRVDKEGHKVVQFKGIKQCV